jgi:AcrR family transcriptional regulator
MEQPASPAPKRRGRQRSAAAEAAILKAAMGLLRKKPLCEVTAEAIAERAKVSKATLYKWWPNKTMVALDAFGALLETELEIPDTGSAKRDFTEQLRDTMAFYQSPHGRLLCQFLAEGQSDAGFLKLFRQRVLKPRRDKLLPIWRRGVERGEIRADVDPELVLDLVFGPMVYRLMAGHGPLGEAEAEAIIDSLFRGLANGAPAPDGAQGRGH